MKMVGHVTSSYYSPNLNSSFALALIKGGLEKKGENFMHQWKMKILKLKLRSCIY